MVVTLEVSTDPVVNVMSSDESRKSIEGVDSKVSNANSNNMELRRMTLLCYIYRIPGDDEYVSTTSPLKVVVYE